MSDEPRELCRGCRGSGLGNYDIPERCPDCKGSRYEPREVGRATPEMQRKHTRDMMARGAAMEARGNDEPRDEHSAAHPVWMPGFGQCVCAKCRPVAEEPREAGYCTNATCTVCDEHNRCVNAPSARKHWQAMPFKNKRQAQVFAQVLAEVAGMEARDYRGTTPVDGATAQFWIIRAALAIREALRLSKSITE